MRQNDVVIVGGGMAGLTAGIYAARAGKKVLVLEAKVYGGQIVNTLNIENWPGDFRVSGADLIKKVKKQAVELGVNFEYDEVVNIAKEENKFRIITIENEYLALAVIIATGTEPRKLSNKQTKDAGERPISY